MASLLLGTACGGAVYSDPAETERGQDVQTGSTAGRVATTDEEVSVLAVDETHVYWNARRTGIWRARKAGGSAEPFVSPTETGSQYVSGIAVDEEAVYWTALTEGTVRKRAKRGGGVSVVASGQNRPWGIAVDADNVYFAAQGDSAVGSKGNDGAIVSVAKHGGAPATLSSGQQQPTALAIDDDGVYFASGPWGDRNGSVRRVPKEGGETQVISDRQSTIRSLAALAGSVYFVEDRTPNYSTFRGALVRASRGQSAEVLDADVPGGGLLALGAGGLAYSTMDDRRMEIRVIDPQNPSGRRVLASRDYPRGLNVFGAGALGADATSAYWSEFTWTYPEGARSGSILASVIP